MLIGSETKSRPGIQYEIARSWALGLGLLGVHIHHLRDAQGNPSAKGESPFDEPLAQLVQVYDPPESDSKLAYRHIADNLAKWIEKAVEARRARP